MATKLAESVSAVSDSDLQITYMDGDLNIIQKLDDEPNDVGGLTAAQLKAKFDEGPNIIKDFINDSLIPEILAADATEEARAQAEASRQTAEAARVAAEDERVAAEATRESAETGRIAEFATMAKQIISATTEATKAADTVNGMTVDAETSQPGSPVSVEKSTNPNGSIHLAFQIPKGEKGDPGRDGSGIGDMLKEDYDASGVVSAKGGITAYVEETTAKKSHAATHAASGTDPITPAAIGAAKATDVYVKSQTLKDTTAEQYGLDGSAVPDDILSWLGRYNEHWWCALHDETVYGYSGKKIEYTKDDDGSYYHFFAYNTSSKKYTYNFSYSDKISVDAESGDISLVAPVKFTYDESVSFVLSDVLSLIATAVAGKFVTGLLQNSSSTGYGDAESGTVSDAVFFIPEDADSGLNGTNKTITTRTGDSDSQRKNVLLGWGEAVTVKALKIVAQYGLLADAGETTYEHSLDRNAYPDSGEQDGTTYTYLGVPFEKFPTAPQIEAGEYVGTGVYESGNENTLKFSFAPKIVIVSATFTESSGSRSYQVYTAIFIRDRACNVGSYRTSTNMGGILPYLPTTWEKKALSWYSSSSAAYQLNESGVTYNYIAIG